MYNSRLQLNMIWLVHCSYVPYSGCLTPPENTDSDSDTDLELMSVGSDDVQEEELPETQHIDPRPLSGACVCMCVRVCVCVCVCVCVKGCGRYFPGLIVYVEVRSGTDSCENRQQAIAHQLELLGATVSQRLTKDVTHMVRAEYFINTTCCCMDTAILESW